MMPTRYGGNGFPRQHLVPRLKRPGVSEEDIRRVPETKPARAFGVSA